MSNNVPISELSKSIIYEYPLIKQRTDMGFLELRTYTDDWRTFERVWMYNYTIRDLMKIGQINSYYIFASSSELRSYKAGQSSHAAMYPTAAALGVFNDIIHTIPDTPVWVSVESGNASATVKWIVPPSNESPILYYTIAAYDMYGNTVNTVTASSASLTTGNIATYIVQGLTNGNMYRFTIYATNNIGNSFTSGFTQWVTPMTIPEPPTSFKVSQYNNFFEASWVVSFNGGTPITSYTLTLCDSSNNLIYDGSRNLLYDASDNPIYDASNNPIYDNSNNLIQIIFTNTTEQGNTATHNIPAIIKYKYDASGNHLQYPLTLGTIYSFKLYPNNMIGRSEIVTLVKPVEFVRVPIHAPINLSAAYSTVDSTITFIFTQDDDTDLRMTTSYTFTSNPVGVFRTVLVSSTTRVGNIITATIKGIPPNKYTFTVYASTHNLGNSPESLISNIVQVIS